MRELKTSDLFKLSGIIRKLNLKKELASVSVKNAEQYGTQLFLLLFENMDQAEKEIVAFFSDIAEMQPDEFRDMGFEQLGQFMNDLINTKGIQNFFTLAFKTTKPK